MPIDQDDAAAGTQGLIEASAAQMMLADMVRLFVLRPPKRFQTPAFERTVCPMLGHPTHP
jgi:hypothetical protein